MRAQGQGRQEVRDPEHRGGGRRQGHLRRERVQPVPAAQAVRQAGLLRQLCHPLQGCQEQIQTGKEGQNSSSQVWIPSTKISRSQDPSSQIKHRITVDLNSIFLTLTFD